MESLFPFTASTSFLLGGVSTNQPNMAARNIHRSQEHPPFVYSLTINHIHCYVSEAGGYIIWLVVEPTHLKNMIVKLVVSSPSRGENKKCLKPPPSHIIYIYI